MVFELGEAIPLVETVPGKHIRFDAETGDVDFPGVYVPIADTTGIYAVKLKLIPNTNPLRFTLMDAVQLERMEVPAEAYCSDLPMQPSITQTEFMQIQNTGRYRQTITIENNSDKVIYGPLYLALDNITPDVEVITLDKTMCPNFLDRPLISVLPTSDNTLGPGQVISVPVSVYNPQNHQIEMTTKLLTINSDNESESNLILTPGYAYKNIDTVIKFEATLPPTASSLEEPIQITLEQVDKNGEPISTLGEFFDNGDISNGDEVRGDGVFSFQKVFSLEQKADFYFQAKLTGGSQSILTKIEKLSFLEPISNEDQDKVFSTQQHVLSRFSSLNPTVGRLSAIQQIEAELKSDPDILGFYYAPPYNYIGLYFSSGLLGGVYMPLDPSKIETASAPTQTQRRISSKRITRQFSQVSSKNMLRSKKVVALFPFKTSQGFYYDVKTAVTKFNENSCFKLDYEPLYDTNATVDAFTKAILTNEGVTIIGTHGGIVAGRTVLLTGQKTNKHIAYDSAHPHHIISFFENNEYYLAITSDFIRYHSKRKKKNGGISIVGACDGYSQNDMANVFLAAGNKEYYGFKDYVGYNPKSKSLEAIEKFVDIFLNHENPFLTSDEAFKLIDSDYKDLLWTYEGKCEQNYWGSYWGDGCRRTIFKRKGSEILRPTPIIESIERLPMDESHLAMASFLNDDFNSEGLHLLNNLPYNQFPRGNCDSSIAQCYYKESVGWYYSMGIDYKIEVKGFGLDKIQYLEEDALSETQTGIPHEYTILSGNTFNTILARENSQNAQDILMMSFRSKPLPEGELEQAEISNIPLLFKATGINQTCQVSSSNKNFSDLSPVTIDIVAEPHPEMFEFKIKDDSPKVLQRGTTTSVNFIAEWTSVGNTAFNYIGHNSWAKTGAFPKYDTRPASVKI